MSIIVMSDHDGIHDTKKDPSIVTQWFSGHQKILVEHITGISIRLIKLTNTQ